jgi:predicted Zn-dependent protease
MMEARKRLVELGPPDAAAHRELAAAYREVAGDLRSFGDAVGAERAFSAYLSVLDRMYRLLPDEGRRDPFASPAPTTTTEVMINRTLRPSPALLREMALLAEMQYGRGQRPERAIDLIERLIDLVVALDAQQRGTAEARLALRRGVALLDRMRAANELPRPMAVMLPFFEKRLGEAPRVPGVDLSPPQRRLLDRMAYGALCHSLIEEKRGGDLVRLLDREAAAAAKTSWAGEGVRRLLLEDALSEPDLLPPLLAAAKKAKDDRDDPLGANGRRLLSLVALYGGEDESARALDSSVGARDFAVSLPLSQHLRQRKSYAGAARVLAAWLRDLKDRVGARDHLSLAELYLLAGQIADADGAVRLALKKAPDDAFVLSMLAAVELRARRFGEARKVLLALRKRSDLDPTLDVPTRLGLGEASLQVGDADEAEQEVRRALAGAKDDANARLALAAVLLERGKDLDEAEKLARAVLAERPGDPWSQFVLGAVLIARKQPKEGLELLAESAREPALAVRPELYDHFGRGYLLAGRADLAKQAWARALAWLPRTADAKDRLRLALEGRLRELEAKR